MAPHWFSITLLHLGQAVGKPAQVAVKMGNMGSGEITLASLQQKMFGDSGHHALGILDKGWHSGNVTVITIISENAQETQYCVNGTRRRIASGVPPAPVDIHLHKDVVLRVEVAAGTTNGRNGRQRQATVNIEANA